MPLGSARAIDFVREYVGIQESRARWLARLGRALNEVPELDQAFVARRLNASQVIELAPVAGAETPVDERLSWIERAAGMSVRELRRAVRAERGRAETAVADPPGDPDEPSPGCWMSIAVPARVAVLWQQALDLARMAAGCHLTQGQAAEMIFAEYLSAAGPTGAEVQARPADSERERLIAEVIAALNRQAEERPRSPEQAGLLGAKGEPPPMPLEQKPAGPPSPMDGPAPEPLPVDCIIHDFKDPHHVGETLVRIAALKTCLRYDLAKLLSVFVRSASPAALGYSDLETYCVERLGFGRRRAERLVRFHSGLEKFPRLATAYLEGRISYTAALLLLQILHPSTEAAWVAWADGMSYREVERVVEHARIYALPEANPAVLACYAQELERQGMARRAADDATAFTADHANGNTPGWQVPDDATAFTADHANVPAGCALPPTVTRGLPKIVGLPKDLLLIPPELCIGHVRFWMPQDALDVAHRALDRCRHSLADPRLRTWVYFEIMLVHFIQSQDTPQAREIERRNQIVARDGFRCLTTGCMSRCNLHGHHLEHRGQQGSDDWWNQASNCAGHHGPCLHKGINEMGGFAPDRLTIRLGIHPKTGRAFAAYRNERRVSDEVAKADITRWRLWWKARHRQMRNRTAPEVVPAAAAIA